MKMAPIGATTPHRHNMVIQEEIEQQAVEEPLVQKCDRSLEDQEPLTHNRTAWLPLVK